MTFFSEYLSHPFHDGVSSGRLKWTANAPSSLAGLRMWGALVSINVSRMIMFFFSSSYLVGTSCKFLCFLAIYVY